MELGGRRLGAGFVVIWAPTLRPGAGFLPGTLSLPEAQASKPVRMPPTREMRLVEGGLVPGTIGGLSFPQSVHPAGIYRIAPESVSRNRT